MSVESNVSVERSHPTKAINSASDAGVLRASALGDSENTLFLLDISAFIFRAFYAIRSLTSPKGEPTNAVYGVAAMLGKLMDEASPRYLVSAFDSKEPSFREEIYPEYKANRSEPPPDLIPQFDRIAQLVDAMGIPQVRQAGVEADDLIATLSKNWLAQSKKHRVIIITSDKDLMQLVTPRVQTWDTMNSKFYDEAAVREKFGIGPELIRDYLGLVGDSSDNIPGVKGVGPKTAVELLLEHGSLEKVVKAAQADKISGKRGETLKEHAELAKLSKRLATVESEVDIKLEGEIVDFARYEFSVGTELEALFEELGFQTLLKKWKARVGDGASAESVTSGKTKSPSAKSGTTQAGALATGASRTTHEITVAGQAAFVGITEERAFLDLLARVERAGEMGFDLETTSLNPREAEIVGVSIAVDEKAGFYIPVGHLNTGDTGGGKQLSREWVMSKLKRLIEDPKCKKIGQNLKYDWSVLCCQGFNPDGMGADTMVAGYLLEPEGRHNLETLCKRYLDYDVMTFEQVAGDGKRGSKQLRFDEVPIDQAIRYSAEDSWAALTLWRTLRPKLDAERLMPVFAQIDMPLVPVLVRMELAGVCIDVPWLEKLSSQFARDLKKIEDRVGAFTDGEINLNSTRQLATLLFEKLGLPPQSKTKTGFSTDASVLEALAPLHEVPRLLLEYREISKLKSTYVDPLPGLLDPRTGKIHAGFHQTVAATGRLSSSDPNLQNIPVRSERGRLIRKAFLPSAGSLLVAADYSQIELRILAHMSKDAELCRSFRADEDVHRRTASEIFGVSAEKVADRQREIAKAINFGLMYGKTAFGLAQELKISRKEAQEIIGKYFERYTGVKKFLDELIVTAKETGVTTTLAGRRRILRDIRASNPMVRANSERMAMNTPIQGTAADLMKLAMIEIDRRLTAEGYKAKLIIQVHDEVIIDAPRDEVAAVQKLVTDSMEHAMNLDIPLRVNSGSGETWDEV